MLVSPRVVTPKYFYNHPLLEIFFPHFSNLTIYLSIYRKKANIFNTISQKQNKNQHSA